ncbi:MAG: polysaccharide deacetylase family protein [Actinomycetota bacterium]|nr:polysaccharide deacetylase family protein [Actinomycetota bacterium]
MRAGRAEPGALATRPSRAGAGRAGRLRRANVLMYHRVAADAGDPYALCVTPERFGEQLGVLTSVADVVPLADVQRTASRGRGRPRVALTFDDGYADNLLAALPIAERFGTPFTVYVTSRMLGATDGFWWDRLARAVLRPGAEAVVAELPGGPYPFVTGTDGPARAALSELRRRLLPLQVDEIEVVVAKLCSGNCDVGAAGPRLLTGDELCVLAAHPLVTIGAHTTDHAMLAARPPSAQLETIATSKTDLEVALGVPVRHFAYPFGHRASFDGRTVDAVRRAGFATACTTLGGCVTPWSAPLCLPRRMVLDWGGAAFAAALGSWGIG